MIVVGIIKTKANAAQAVPEMIEISSNGIYSVNMEGKHSLDARYGWYRYDSRFAVAIYNSNGEVDRYNVFKARMIIRHDADGRKYLYDDNFKGSIAMKSIYNQVAGSTGEKMRTDILQHLKNELYSRCNSPSNHFGMGVYYHIEAVVKNAELLADKFGADKEVVMLAAWLHDIASVTDYALYEEHHIHGAEMAQDILAEFGYDEDKIPLVQECIRNHRGSLSVDRNSIEEICVADADAISHFDSIPSLLYLAYVRKQLSIEEGAQFVRNKLERSFQKMSPESRDFYKEKYTNAMKLLV